MHLVGLAAELLPQFRRPWNAFAFFAFSDPGTQSLPSISRRHILHRGFMIHDVWRRGTRVEVTTLPGRYNASIFAANTKSFSDRPPALWVQVMIPTLPQPRVISGW